MGYLRRQRRKLLLITLLILQQLVRQIHCQAALRQYHHRPSNINNNNNILVSNLSQQLAQSLPLTRQQHHSHPNSQQQQPDLDNVIESTTSLVALQQQQRQPSAKISIASTATPTTTTTSCRLPPTWAGKWYQSNKEPIRVTRTEISDKGLCRDQKGDKYLFESVITSSGSGGINSKLQQQQQTSPCLICLVINERHLNVLQYKESSCQPVPANYYNRTNVMLDDEDHSLLDSICSDITGDAQLESLFRLDTPPIECPISGQYSFTYDSCREPQSSLDSCIDKKQLNFKFLACPDVPGSESKSEVLKCYADWSEGNNYYMIGRMEYTSNHQDKDKFRCFVYEKSPDGKSIQMAQSLEESCYGLINANEGPKTLRLTVKPPTTQKCNFPSYIQSLSDNWLSVDNSLIYMFNQDSTKYQVKETKEGNVIEEATCLQQFAFPQSLSHAHSNHPIQYARSNTHQQVVTDKRYLASASNYPQADQSFQHAASRPATNEVAYLVQITKGCTTTNYCVRFYRRSNGIVQIDYFISPNSDNQCRVAFQATAQTQIITSTNLEHQRCPFEGAYTIEAPIESDLTYNPSNIFICPNHSFLTAQCNQTGRLQIWSRCANSKKLVRNLYCLGSWTTNGLVRLLLSDDYRQRYSAWYRDHTSLQQEVNPSADSSTGSPSAWQQQQQQPPSTRSQHLLTAAGGNQPQHQQLATTAPANSIVDLQIALISQQPIVAKSMQVRLTRRLQCSDLQRHNPSLFADSSSASGSGSSIPSYLTSATASSSAATGPSSCLLLVTQDCYCSTLLRLSMIFVLTLLMSRLPVASQ